MLEPKLNSYTSAKCYFCRDASPQDSLDEAFSHACPHRPVRRCRLPRLLSLELFFPVPFDDIVPSYLSRGLRMAPVRARNIVPGAGHVAAATACSAPLWHHGFVRLTRQAIGGWTAECTTRGGRAASGTLVATTAALATKGGEWSLSGSELPPSESATASTRARTLLAGPSGAWPCTIACHRDFGGHLGRSYLAATSALPMGLPTVESAEPTMGSAELLVRTVGPPTRPTEPIMGSAAPQCARRPFLICPAKS